MHYLYLVWILLIPVMDGQQTLPEYVTSECYGNSFNFDCGQGNIIRITRDFFGYSNTDRCQPSRDDCIVNNPNTDSLIHRYCTGKKTCPYFQVERRACNGLYTNYQQVEYQCVPEKEVIDMCQVSNTLSKEAYISSPNFPQNYPPGLDCSCYITSSVVGARILLEVMYMSIKYNSPCGDWLKVGRDRMCGLAVDLYSGKQMPLEFHTDGEGGHAGFWLYLKASRPDAQLSVTCRNTTLQTLLIRRRIRARLAYRRRMQQQRQTTRERINYTPNEQRPRPTYDDSSNREAISENIYTNPTLVTQRATEPSKPQPTQVTEVQITSTSNGKGDFGVNLWTKLPDQESNHYDNVNREQSDNIIRPPTAFTSNETNIPVSPISIMEPHTRTNYDQSFSKVSPGEGQFETNTNVKTNPPLEERQIYSNRQDQMPNQHQTVSDINRYNTEYRNSDDEIPNEIPLDQMRHIPESDSSNINQQNQKPNKFQDVRKGEYSHLGEALSNRVPTLPNRASDSNSNIGEEIKQPSQGRVTTNKNIPVSVKASIKPTESSFRIPDTFLNYNDNLDDFSDTNFFTIPGRKGERFSNFVSGTTNQAKEQEQFHQEADDDGDDGGIKHSFQMSQEKNSPGIQLKTNLDSKSAINTQITTKSKDSDSSVENTTPTPFNIQRFLQDQYGLSGYNPSSKGDEQREMDDILSMFSAPTTKSKGSGNNVQTKIPNLVKSEKIFHEDNFSKLTETNFNEEDNTYSVNIENVQKEDVFNQFREKPTPFLKEDGNIANQNKEMFSEVSPQNYDLYGKEYVSSSSSSLYDSETIRDVNAVDGNTVKDILSKPFTENENSYFTYTYSSVITAPDSNIPVKNTPRLEDEMTTHEDIQSNIGSDHNLHSEVKQSKQIVPTSSDSNFNYERKQPKGNVLNVPQETDIDDFNANVNSNMKERPTLNVKTDKQDLENSDYDSNFNSEIQDEETETVTDKNVEYYKNEFSDIYRSIENFVTNQSEFFDLNNNAYFDGSSYADRSDSPDLVDNPFIQEHNTHFNEDNAYQKPLQGTNSDIEIHDPSQYGEQESINEPFDRFNTQNGKIAGTNGQNEENAEFNERKKHQGTGNGEFIGDNDKQNERHSDYNLRSNKEQNEKDGKFNGSNNRQSEGYREYTGNNNEQAEGYNEFNGSNNMESEGYNEYTGSNSRESEGYNEFNGRNNKQNEYFDLYDIEKETNKITTVTPLETGSTLSNTNQNRASKPGGRHGDILGKLPKTDVLNNRGGDHGNILKKLPKSDVLNNLEFSDHGQSFDNVSYTDFTINDMFEKSKNDTILNGNDKSLKDIDSLENTHGERNNETDLSVHLIGREENEEDGSMLTLGLVILSVCVSAGIILLTCFFMALLCHRRKQRASVAPRPTLAIIHAKKEMLVKQQQDADSGRSLLIHAEQTHHSNTVESYAKGRGHQSVVDVDTLYAKPQKQDKVTQADICSDDYEEVLVHKKAVFSIESDSEDSNYSGPIVAPYGSHKAVQAKSILVNNKPVLRTSRILINDKNRPDSTTTINRLYNSGGIYHKNNNNGVELDPDLYQEPVSCNYSQIVVPKPNIPPKPAHLQRLSVQTQDLHEFKHSNNNAAATLKTKTIATMPGLAEMTFMPENSPVYYEIDEELRSDDSDWETKSAISL